MDDSQFWKIIHEASRNDDFISQLTNSLCDLGFDEIVSFKNILQKKLASAYYFPLLSANFVISSYVSDDGFEGFRAWLLSKGQAAFENAIENPETIADWLEKSKVDQIDGEAFLSVAENAYTELGGNERDFYKDIEFQPMPDMTFAWPASKTEYQREYSKLVDKYWNHQRIKEMHQ